MPELKDTASNQWLSTVIVRPRTEENWQKRSLPSHYLLLIESPAPRINTPLRSNRWTTRTDADSMRSHSWEPPTAEVLEEIQEGEEIDFVDGPSRAEEPEEPQDSIAESYQEIREAPEVRPRGFRNRVRSLARTILRKCSKVQVEEEVKEDNESHRYKMGETLLPREQRPTEKPVVATSGLFEVPGDKRSVALEKDSIAGAEQDR